MSFLFNFLSSFVPKIKTTKTTETRSFTSFDNNSNQLSNLHLSKNGEMSLVKNTGQNDSVVYKYANNNILQTNYTQILEKLVRLNKMIKSDSPYVSGEIEKSLETIGFNSEFIEKCFYELYMGNGEVYIFIEQINETQKLVAIPRYQSGKTLVQRFVDKDDELKQIKIGDRTLDISDVFVLYNTKVGNEYYSNLKLAIPFIKLKNQLLSHNLDNATSGMGYKTLFSFDPKQFQNINESGVVLENTENIKLQLKSLLESNSKSVYLPFQIDAKPLQSNNAQNQTNFLLEYCDEQIQICCYSNGSMSGRDGTANRSVSEQDRSNFDDTTVKFFMERIKSIANSFLIPQLISNPKDFEFTFFDPDINTIKEKEQSIRTLDFITSPNFLTLLEKNDLKISKDSIIEILQLTHSIEIVPKSKLEVTNLDTNSIISPENKEL